MSVIKRLLYHPLAKNIPLDDPQLVSLRRKVIKEKPFLKQIYDTWYKMIINAIPLGKHPILELGAGAGFLKEYIPDLICSDILWVSHLDLICDGRFFPFKSESLQCIVMVDVLHHIPDANRFFTEADRCLCNGGRIILIEPWVTTWSQFIYQHLHHEPFNTQTEQWSFPSSGPLSSANSALPWVIFERDKQLFQNAYPNLRIEKITIFMPFLYLLSGGVSYRSFLPTFTYPFWAFIENLLQPWMNHFGLFAFILIEKRDR